MTYRPACLALIVVSALLLNACGSKGPLMLPDSTPVKQARPATIPPAQAAPARTADDHSSTTTPPASQ